MHPQLIRNDRSNNGSIWGYTYSKKQIYFDRLTYFVYGILQQLASHSNNKNFAEQFFEGPFYNIIHIGANFRRFVTTLIYSNVAAACQLVIIMTFSTSRDGVI